MRKKKQISIKTFIFILEAASRGEVSPPSGYDKNLYSSLIKSLEKESLLEVENKDPLFGGGHVRITVKGALALSRWKEDLRKESFSYRFGENVLKLLWLIVGALIVFLADIIKSNIS